MQRFNFLSLVLLIILGLAGWELFSLNRALGDAEMRAERMEQHASELEKRVLELEQSLANAESMSLERMTEEAGKQVLDGWDSLIDEFEDRLQQSREKILEQLQLEPMDRPIEEQKDDQT